MGVAAFLCAVPGKGWLFLEWVHIRIMEAVFLLILFYSFGTRFLSPITSLPRPCPSLYKPSHSSLCAEPSPLPLSFVWLSVRLGSHLPQSATLPALSFFSQCEYLTQPSKFTSAYLTKPRRWAHPISGTKFWAYGAILSREDRTQPVLFYRHWIIPQNIQ